MNCPRCGRPNTTGRTKDSPGWLSCPECGFESVVPPEGNGVAPTPELEQAINRAVDRLVHELGERMAWVTIYAKAYECKIDDYNGGGITEEEIETEALRITTEIMGFFHKRFPRPARHDQPSADGERVAGHGNTPVGAGGDQEKGDE